MITRLADLFSSGFTLRDAPALFSFH